MRLSVVSMRNKISPQPPQPERVGEVQGHPWLQLKHYYVFDVNFFHFLIAPFSFLFYISRMTTKYIPQGEAVMKAVQAVLESKNLAEDVQYILCYIAEHEGYAVYESSTTYMRKILDLVCEQIEPEQAIF